MSARSRHCGWCGREFAPLLLDGGFCGRPCRLSNRRRDVVAAQSWWPALPGKARLGAAVGGVGYLSLVAPALGVPAGVWLAGQAAKGGKAHWQSLRVAARHHLTYVEPLHRALAPLFGYDPDALAPAAWLDVPLDLLDGVGGITIMLPTDRVPTPKQQDEVVRVTVEKLGLRDYKAEWRLTGTSRHLHLSKAPPKPQVPELVRFADVYGLVCNAKPSAPVLALGVGGRPVAIDFATETPHVLFSCTTGWGKSSAVGLVAAHVLHHGGDVVIPDIKVISLEPFEGLDGVTYADDVEGIHDLLVKVGRVIAHRNREVKRRKQAGRPAVEWPRLLVILEELNACRDELAEYWMEVREKGDRRPSPALKAYKHMLLMGRAVNVNGIAITQSGTAHAVGGPAYREQFGSRILGWYTQNMWNMLIPQHKYVMATNRRGHGWMARGQNAWECQFIYATEAELVAYATSGKAPACALTQLPAADPAPSLGGGQVPGSAGSDPGGPGLALVPDFDDDDLVGPVSLRDASSNEGVDGGIVPLTLQQLHNDRKRHRNDFPSPLVRASNGVDLYDRGDLIEWAAKRPMSRQRQEA